MDRLEADGLQHAPMERLVPGRQVANRDAQNQARVERPPFGKHLPAESPPLDGTPGNVARADDDVGSVAELAIESLEMTRLVGEVGIHLEEILVVALESPPKRLDVSGTEAE